MEPKIFEIYTGKIKTYGEEKPAEPFDGTYTTAAFKQPTGHRVFLSALGITGDEQADKRFHGGPDKALFMYPKSHYETLSEIFNKEIPVGGNGENVSIIGITESDVCIGDVYTLGEAVIEVTQPRRPCWKPARRHRELEFSRMIQDTGLTGWYFRVLQEGYFDKDSVLTLKERPCKTWTLEQINRVLYNETDDLKRAESLAKCPYIPKSFKVTLNKRLEGEVEDDTRRLYGPNLN